MRAVETRALSGEELETLPAVTGDIFLLRALGGLAFEDVATGSLETYFNRLAS